MATTPPPSPLQVRAIWMLVLATFCWGASFVSMKTWSLTQQQLIPEASLSFITCLSLVLRFGLAALLVLAWNFSGWRRVTREELKEGAVLGVVGGLGLFLQMDALNYTAASTSAFLTQAYCIFLPLIAALRHRRWPSPVIFLSTLLVLGGIAVLAQVNGNDWKIGRGELETLLATLFFTVQILWLERPFFRRTKAANFSIVMYAVTAVLFLPGILTGGQATQIFPALQGAVPIGLILVLTLVCTVVAYGLMNRWQPHLEAAKAGLIYCAEPVFASIFALFVPGLVSAWSGISYANEHLTWRLALGGGLITAANLLIIWQATRETRVAQ